MAVESSGNADQPANTSPAHPTHGGSPRAAAHATVDAISQDISCPGCGYNLRGLGGSIITCPECGVCCDAARLVAVRWNKPWHRAPGFNTLLLPIVWIVLAPLVFLLSLIGLDRMATGITSDPRTWFGTSIGMLNIAVVFTLFFAGWLWLMWRAWRVFHGMRGIWLALLAHVLTVGYLASIIYGVVLLSSGIFTFMGAPAYGILVSGLGLTLLVGGVWVCRRGERYIARQCIRRYLDEQVIVDPAAA